MERLRVTLCVLFGLLAAPSLGAPPLIAYQGRLLDAQGSPMNGSVSLDFALFEAASGGPPLWTEMQPSVSVIDGVYSVNLGTVTPLDPSLLAGAERWLQVGVNGETLAPRQRFVSAPYALRAGAIDGPALPSLDALRGLPCNLGTAGVGTVTLTYAANQLGTVSLACTPSQSFTLTVQNLTPNTTVAAPGINCSTIAGSDCSETYVAMTGVTLSFTAIGCTNRTFGGACAGTPPGNNCTLTMDGPKSVTFSATCG